MKKQRIKTYEIIDGVAKVSGFIEIEPAGRNWREISLDEILNDPLFADIK